MTEGVGELLERRGSNPSASVLPILPFALATLNKNYHLHGSEEAFVHAW